METTCLPGDLAEHRRGHDHEYYRHGRFHDGDRCGASPVPKVLQVPNQDSQVQRVPKAERARQAAQLSHPEVRRDHK
jgi:hypothetical protein